ncbi:DUF6415 family natural product biosynthesis protein [Streptomyces noursei]|uniref:DUF6415 family natural product biosynthesis protein n=1 Tax=Streptomyces noursei TaxID=1971 RepID=UPI0033DD016A
MSDPNLILELTAVHRTVSDALRESVGGHPRPTLAQLQRLPPKLRSHMAELLPVVGGLLRAMDADDPGRGDISLTIERAQAAQSTRLTGNFPHDVDNMRYLARLVASLVDIIVTSPHHARVNPNSGPWKFTFCCNNCGDSSATSEESAHGQTWAERHLKAHPEHLSYRELITRPYEAATGAL